MIKHINIKDRSYKITFKKSKRAKRIQLKIYKTGEIFLIVPYRSTYEQGNNFLMKSISWLEKKVDKLDFNTEKLRYFGEEIEIKYSSSNEVFFLLLHLLIISFPYLAVIICISKIATMNGCF